MNPNMFPQNQNYVFYELYKRMESELEAKNELSPEEEERLVNVKANFTAIEQYSAEKRAEGIRWSLTSLFQDSGMNPTLILEFHPGTDSYKKYGKNLVVNVEYSDDDLKHIFESIRDNAVRVTGQLKFKTIPENEDGELNTGDIFGIQ